ncbi:MAG: RNA polymerase sigma factor [Acidobacteria bacterium]|nr:RNA polymerase sigma factor [Acidobacteriota bacterium]MCB9396781.1 RNA polymerase sigma factor [Acidobacteriota bacterium]
MGTWFTRSEKSDEAWAEAFQAGSQQAFEALYHRHQAKLFTLCLRNLGQNRAEDCLQEIFMALYTALPGFRGQAKFKTWMYKIALNCISRHYGPDPEPLDPDMEGSLRHQPEPTLNLWLEQAITALPHGYRHVLLLHDVAGFKHDEIGEILGITAPTSRSQLARARTNLRTLMVRQQKKEIGHEKAIG